MSDNWWLTFRNVFVIFTFKKINTKFLCFLSVCNSCKVKCFFVSKCLFLFYSNKFSLLTSLSAFSLPNEFMISFHIDCLTYWRTEEGGRVFQRESQVGDVTRRGLKVRWLS
jgi:hypothetical protein